MQLITLDVETDSLDPQTANIYLIGYRLEGKGGVHHIEHPVRGKPDETINKIISNPNSVLRGHNVKFDALCLANYGYNIQCSFDDTKLLAYLHWPNEESGLKNLVKKKLHKEVTEFSDIIVKPKKKDRGDYEKDKRYVQYDKGFIDFARLKEYNKEDVINCDSLRMLLPDTPWYLSCEQPLLRLLFNTEFTGSYLNRPYLENLDIEFSQEMAPKYEYLTKYCENPNSSMQVAEAYVKMGFDLSRLAEKTPTGKAKIDKIFLKRLAWKGHEFSRTLLEYRKLEKIRTTYIQSLLQRMDKSNRIHGSFNQSGSEDEDGDSRGTRTGRLTSSEPNLQNIPSRTLYGKAVRKAFCATPGWLLFDFDLSQIEPRILAHFSQSKKLLDAFRNKVDTHAMFGADIFGKDPAKLTKTERFIGKTSWLATLYGCWYKKLLHICEVNSDEPLDIDFSNYLIGFDSLPGHLRSKLINQAASEEEARTLYAKEAFFAEVQDSFRQKNPELFSWKQAHIDKTRRLGYVTTIGGRVIKIEGLDSKNEWERKSAERLAINYTIQGSAADAMKMILVRFDKEFISNGLGRLLATVHDEILGETQREDNIEFAREIMEDTVKLNNVEVVCSGGIIDNWGEKK